MPILTKDGKRILQIHIPKTGGTSVTVWAHDNDWKVEKFAHEHFPWATPADEETKDIWAWDYSHAPADVWSTWGEFDDKFAVFRHPFERMRSEITYNNVPRRDVSRWMRKLFQEHKYNPRVRYNHVRPQVDFLAPGVKVFKFGGHWDGVRKILGATGKPSHQRKRRKGHYHLTAVERMEIAEFYREDMKYWESLDSLSDSDYIIHS